MPEPDLPGLVPVRHRGIPWWWLYESRCGTCGLLWLVAQEERFNDVYVLRRLSDFEANRIESEDIWPTDFDKYETLLRVGAQAGHKARFADPRDETLQEIVANILLHRPLISVTEVSALVNVNYEEAAWLREATERAIKAASRAQGT